MCQVQFHIATAETTPGDPNSRNVKEVDSRSKLDRRPSLAPVGESYGAHVLILRLDFGFVTAVISADRPNFVFMRSRFDLLRGRTRFNRLGDNP